MPVLKFNVEADYQEVEKLRKEINTLEDTLRNFKPGTAQSTVEALQEKLATCRQQFQGLIKDAADAGAKVETTLRNQLSRAASKSDINVKVKADTADFHRKMLDTDKDFQDVMKNLDSYSQKLTGVFASMSKLAGFTAPLLGVLGFLNKVKDTRTYFQDIESTMTVLLGSEQKSLEFCKQLQAAAYWNMFEYSDLVGASKQMIAYGVATDKVIPRINQLSEVATATKGSLDEMVWMYTRAKSIGYVDSRALQTWASRGLVVKDVLKEMGEKAAGSKVTFEQLNKVLDHVTGEGGMFHGVMANQMQNISAEIGQLEDNASLMFNEIGEAMQEPLVKVIKAAGWAVENWKLIGGAMATAGAAYTVFKMARAADTKAYNAELDETTKKVNELKEAEEKRRQGLAYKEKTYDDDIKEAVATGKLSSKDAEKLQENRDYLSPEVTQRRELAEAIEQERAALERLNKEKKEEPQLDDDLKLAVNEGLVSEEDAVKTQELRVQSQELIDAKKREAAAAQAAADSFAKQRKEYEQNVQDAKVVEEQAIANAEALRKQYEEQERLKQSYLDQGMDEGEANNAVKEKIDNLISLADVQEAQADAEAATEQRKRAETELTSAAVNEKAAADKAAALESDIAAVNDARDASAKQTKAIATQQAANATRGETAAQVGNKTATLGSLAVDKLATTGKWLLKSATDSLKMSVKSLFATLMANPIGMLLGAISALVAAFFSFKDDADEATEEEQKFGEAAVKTKNEVDTLYSVLAATNKESLTHKKALSDLTKIAKEYGITITDESKKYEELIEQREKLIRLIEEEGRQRQIANTIAEMEKDKKDISDNFSQSLDDAFEDIEKFQKTALTGIIQDSIDKNRNKIIELYDRLDRLNHTKLNDKDSDYQFMSSWLQGEVKKTKEEIRKLVYGEAQTAAEGMGVKDNVQWWRVASLNPEDSNVKDYAQSLADYYKSRNAYIERQEVNNRFLELNHPNKPDYEAMDAKDRTKAYREERERLKALKEAAEETNKQKVEIKVDSSQVKEADKSAKEAKTSTENLGKPTTVAKVDSSQISEAKQKAEDADNALMTYGDNVATPGVETKNIEKGTEKAEETNEELDRTKEKRTPLIGTQSIEMAIGKADELLGILMKVDAFGGGSTGTALGPTILDKAGEQIPLPNQKPSAQELWDLSHPKQGDGISEAEKDAAESWEDTKKKWRKRLAEANDDILMGQFISDVTEERRKEKYGTKERKFFQEMIDAGNKKDPNKKNKTKDDPKQRAYNNKKAADAEVERQKEQAFQREVEARELEIKQMDEGEAKEIAQIRLNSKKKLHEIDKAVKAEADKLEEADKKKWLNEAPKGQKRHDYDWESKGKDKTKDYTKLAEENIGAQTKRETEAFDTSEAMDDIFKNSRKAWNDLYIEYGNYEEKILATTRKYQQEIEDAKSSGEKTSLKMKLHEELKEINDNAFKDKINWEAVFSDLNNASEPYLLKLREQLQEALKVDNISAENAKILTDKINEINHQLTEKQGFWTQYGGNIVNTFASRAQEQKILQGNLDTAKAHQSAAEEQENRAEVKVANDQMKVWGELNKYGVKIDGKELNPEDITAYNSDEVMRAYADAGGKDLAGLQDKLTTLGTSEMDLTKATKGMEDATANVANAEGAMAGAGGGGAGLAATDAIIHGVNDNLQALPELLDQMGLSETSFAKGMTDFAESSQYATEAFDNLKQGNLVGTASSLVNAFGSLGNALGKWGIGGMGASDKTLESDIERLTAVNEALINAVQELTEEMQDASIADAADYYYMAKEDLETSMANTQNLMARSAAAYNNGFAGIGGKGSSNKKIDQNISGSDWARVSQAVQTVTAGKSVNGAAAFFNLTSEEMAAVAKLAPDVYSEIKRYASKGYADASGYMDSYIEYYKQLEDLQNSYYESLTDVSFDSLKGEFKSALLDMSSDAEDFTENFESMMQNAVINSLMTSKYNDMLEDWYEEFADYMESDNGLSTWEQTDLKNKWADIVESAVEERDALIKAMDWDVTATQQSTRKSLSAMSQDTGDAIEGRLTALQIATESIRSSHELQLSSLADINDEMLQIINQNANAAFRRDAIEEQVARIYLEVQGIGDNTKLIAEAIAPIRDDIAKIEQHTKRI